MSRLTLLLSLLWLFLSGLPEAFAQKEYTSSVPKAVRNFETALHYYDNRDNTKALEALDEALKAE